MNTRSNFIKNLGIPLITIVIASLTVEARANESANVKAHPVKLDAQGCRILSPLPPPGVHPRIFFTAADLPAMRERLAHPAIAPKVATIRERGLIKIKANNSRTFARMDFTRQGIIKGNKAAKNARADWPDEFAGVTDEYLIRYLKNSSIRADHLGTMSLISLLEDDEELAAECRKILCNWSRILLAAKKRSSEKDHRKIPFLKKRLVDFLSKKKRWHHDSQSLIGTPGFPLAYDVLYNGMSDEERDLVRRAIATVTAGRWSHGMGADPGGASSNHYGYHGDLAVMVAAIEGEPGYDKKVWDGISQVLRDYWEVGWTPFGACHEDWYGPNHGLNAGGRGLMVLARRGYNAFATEKFPHFMTNMLYEHDPYPGGLFNGGASGGPGGIMAMSIMISHYMYPQNTVANFNWRHRTGENHRQGGGLAILLFGGAWKGPETRQAMLESTGLPLAKHYPVRGKYIARSDWSDESMYLALDARPDAHQIGHDKVDRGNFTMSALGRRWATTGMFWRYQLSTENNLVHIDGKAQERKAPSVRFLMTGDDGTVASAVADLKYAYDWKWKALGHGKPEHLARMVERAKEDGWVEPEPNSPVDLGWPEEWSDSPACPDLVHGSQIHYYGTYYLYRRPFNPVQKALRSSQLVRGKWPYTLISDDIRKDDEARLYQWYMQMPNDLELQSQGANQVILAEKEGDRAILVRFLQDADCEFEFELYQVGKKNDKPLMCNRLIASCTAVDPQFRVLLYPFRKGAPMPKITGGKGEFTISIGEQVDQLSLGAISKEGAGVSVTRQ